MIVVRDKRELKALVDLAMDFDFRTLGVSEGIYTYMGARLVLLAAKMIGLDVDEVKDEDEVLSIFRLLHPDLYGLIELIFEETRTMGNNEALWKPYSYMYIYS